MHFLPKAIQAGCVIAPKTGSSNFWMTLTSRTALQLAVHLHTRVGDNFSSNHVRFMFVMRRMKAFIPKFARLRFLTSQSVDKSKCYITPNCNM